MCWIRTNAVPEISHHCVCRWPNTYHCQNITRYNASRIVIQHLSTFLRQLIIATTDDIFRNRGPWLGVTKPPSVNFSPQLLAMMKPLIARFMGPTWGPSGADRTQVGPMLGPWTLLSARDVRKRTERSKLDLTKLPALAATEVVKMITSGTQVHASQCFGFGLMISEYCYQPTVVSHTMTLNDTSVILLGLAIQSVNCMLASVNSLRPSDAYMRQWTNHHWFR